MRMNRESGKTAAEILNQLLPQRPCSFFRFAEFKNAGALAGDIGRRSLNLCNHRRPGPPWRDSYPRNANTQILAKIYQAFMEVNEEIRALEGIA